MLRVKVRFKCVKVNQHTLCLSFLIAPTTLNGDCTDGSVRLVGGANDTLGLVEVCINNGWGGVCVDHFGTNDAEVVCNQLGFSHDGRQLVYVCVVNETSLVLFSNRKLHCLS